MSHLKYILFCILVLALQPQIFCDAPTEVSNGNTDTIDFATTISKKYHFTYDSGTNQILHIVSKPSKFSNPGYLYASFDEDVSEDNRLFSSQNIGINELYINLDKYPDKTGIYVLARSHNKQETSTNTEIKFNIVSEIELTDENKKAIFKFSHNSNVYYTVTSDMVNKKILIYSLGENWKYFNMNIQYEGLTEPLIAKQIYENGYGIVINLNEFTQGKKITIVLTPEESNKETKVEVGYEIIDQGDENKRKVDILEHVYGSTNSFETCYEMKENVDIK